jgi:hypothetical protein
MLSAAHALKEGDAGAGAQGVGLEEEEEEEDGISEGVRGDLWEIDPQLGIEFFLFSFSEGVRDYVGEIDPQLGTQFTCITGTNVRKLTQKELRCCMGRWIRRLVLSLMALLALLVEKYRYW